MRPIVKVQWNQLPCGKDTVKAMKNIKQQFENFRQNTPRHVQWLLLGAAFVIVIILLTLLLTHKSKNTEKLEQIDANLKYSPQSIMFNNVFVGERKTEMIDVSANRDIFVENIDIHADGFTVVSDCEEELIKSCTIYVNYEPTVVQEKTTTNVVITWHIKNQDEIKKTAKISVTYNAQKMAEPKPVEKPKPIVEPEPVVEPEPEYDDEDEFDDIIVDNPFEEPEPEPEPMLAPEKCSEFAIPGYDASGRQIGWIKPTGGANYFHPFSDKDCSNPTGKYDFETGVITSLKDGSKIGTDSDHIGYRNVRSRNLSVPQLSSPQKNIAHATNGEFSDNAVWGPTDKDKNPLNLSDDVYYNPEKHKTFDRTKKKTWEEEELKGSGRGESVVSSKPYDRTFILRQFKPIPATIVSEVRADPSVYGCSKKRGTTCEGENYSVPVRATVDRNVYSDDGRTIILPTGTLLMGYLDGDLPGPYQSFGRMNIRWYQFIRPDGVEFNFDDINQDPYSADAQGRMGVPGHGSTDYVEQMVMPVITALVPAAVNMIAPITDTVINQIDLDNNTIVQSGTIRSSEMAKQDIINTWNKITQKLIVDAIDNTVPPFSIAAGTRINVFSPVDLIVSCDSEENKGKKCSFITSDYTERAKWSDLKKKVTRTADDASWVGQVRSFNLNQYCQYNGNKVTIDENSNWDESGYDYRTVLAYCEAQNYQAINNAKQQAYNKQVQDQADKKKQEYGATWNADTGWTTDFSSPEAEQQYNTEVLGLTYDEDGNIVNPFGKNAGATVEEGLTCEDGSAPDLNGCCAGETFTDMGEDGWNCCPDAGGDCFPPIKVE